MLESLRKILLLTSPRSAAEPAFDRALILAKAANAVLTLLDVAEAPPAEAKLTMPERTLETLLETSHEAQTARLEELRERARAAGISADTIAESGDPYRRAIEHVLADDYDLLIKTNDSLPTGARAAYGSTDKHLLRKCPCPTWIVHPEHAPRHATILAAVDPSPDDPERHELSTKVLGAAARIAAVDGAALHVLHAWRVFGELWLRAPRPVASDPEVDHIVGQTLNRHAQMLDDLLERTPMPEISVERHLVHQEAAQAIIDFTRQRRVDLLVIGTVGRSGIPGLLIGNTAEQVLAEVACSVLAFKPSGFVSPVSVTQ